MEDMYEICYSQRYRSSLSDYFVSGNVQIEFEKMNYFLWSRMIYLMVRRKNKKKQNELVFAYKVN